MNDVSGNCYFSAGAAILGLSSYLAGHLDAMAECETWFTLTADSRLALLGAFSGVPLTSKWSAEDPSDCAANVVC